MPAVVATTALALGLSACGSHYSTAQILSAQGVRNVTETAGSTQATGAVVPGPGSATSSSGQPTTSVGPTSVGQGPNGVSATSPGSIGATQGSTTSPVAQGAAAAGCTKQGAPLVVGQVGAWSGLVGQSDSNARTGLAVWANDVNSRGGVACHPIKLYSIDDQSDGSKSSAAVNDLVQNKGAQVLVASFVPIVSSAYRSAVERNKMPTIGGDYVSQDWSESPYLYPVGGGPEAAYTIALKASVAQGMKKVALWYCVEAAACSYGENLVKKNAARVGAQVVYETSTSLTQSDFTSQCQNSRAAGAQAVYSFADGSSVQRETRSCNNLGYNPLILTDALAAIAPLRTDPNVNKGGLIFSPRVFPWMLDNSPARKAFQDAYKLYAPNAPTDASAAQAWASGKMLEAVIATLGQNAVDNSITTAMVMEGLGKIKNVTLGGLIPPTTFAYRQPKTTPITCSYVALLKDQAWQPVGGGKLECL